MPGCGKVWRGRGLCVRMVMGALQSLWEASMYQPVGKNIAIFYPLASWLSAGLHKDHMWIRFFGTLLNQHEAENKYNYKTANVFHILPNSRGIKASSPLVNKKCNVELYLDFVYLWYSSKRVKDPQREKTALN